MNSLPDHFFAVCQAIGRRVPLWTQGAGSNVSCKEGDSLWIKASGYRLDAVADRKTVAKVHVTETQRILESLLGEGSERDYSEVLKQAASREPDLGRPSMETGFHLFLPARWVFHFHSLPAILMADEYFRDQFAFLDWARTEGGFPLRGIEVVSPGWELTRRLTGASSQAVFLLQNHGIILQAEHSPLEMLEQWFTFEKKYLVSRRHHILEEVGELGSTQVMAGLGPTPFKIYFPDAAVFAERVLQHSKGVPGDRDAAELWMANQLLYHSRPELCELPSEMWTSLPNLPTELVRQNREVM